MGGSLESRMHEGEDAATYVELRRRLAVLKRDSKRESSRGSERVSGRDDP